MGRDDGDIGWGHGRKATTHSLTLYAVKLLGNDFVTLLVPQRSRSLSLSTRILTVAAATLFFERVTDDGDGRLLRRMHITARAAKGTNGLSLIYVRFA